MAASALYDALASVYDRWQRADGMTPFSQVVLAKLLPMLERFGAESPAATTTTTAATPETGTRSFLDLGCGTGDLLLGLARAHSPWNLVGIDGSAAMLDVARGKSGAERVHWTQGTLTALPSLDPLDPPLLDAAGCFYDTLNHLADVAELNAAVRGVAALLRPGAPFFFDVTNELGFDRWWRGNRAWRERDWGVAIETQYDDERRLAQAEVTIDDGGRRTQASLSERYFTDGEIHAALEAAGLDVVLSEPWSPFDNDAPGKTWWIGRKRRA